MVSQPRSRDNEGIAIQPPSGDKRFKMLDATIKRHQYQQDALIEILHKAQELFGYLETDLLLYIAHSLKLMPNRVYGVATFYHLFSLTPKGIHRCVVCTGTACYVKGAAALLAVIEQMTHLHSGETTANKSAFTVNCSLPGCVWYCPCCCF